MGQHLVDDHLEEQRRDEGENLHEERSDQHMGERLAVAPQRGREPQEAEGARIDSGAAELPRHEDQHGIGFGLQFVERQFARDPGDGIDDAEFSRRCLAAKNAIAAGPEPQDRRNRRAGQTRGRRVFDHARLEADHLRRADEIPAVGLGALHRQLLDQMRRIGRDAIIGGNAA